MTFNSEVTFNNLTLTLTLPAFKYFASFLFDTQQTHVLDLIKYDMTVFTDLAKFLLPPFSSDFSVVKGAGVVPEKVP